MPRPGTTGRGRPRLPQSQEIIMIRIETRPGAIVATLAIIAAAALAPAHADTLLKSDASWKVTPVAPAAGWNVSVGFDDSAWESATALYDVADYLGPSYTAQGIWSSGGQFSTTETAVWS